jgi:hypothetical protein
MRKLGVVLALLLLSAFTFATPPFHGAACAQSCVEPPANLVAWWAGDGNAQDLAGDNHGTLEGDVVFNDGMIEQAFSFDGEGDYVSVPDAPSLNPQAALTVDAWIRRSAQVGPWDPVVKKAGGENGDQTGGYTLEFSGDHIAFQVFLENEWWVSSPSAALPSDEWAHVAGVYDGEYVRLYVDGVEIATAANALGSIAPSDNELHIGHDPSNPDRWYNGLIDEVDVFDRALSADEIYAIYAAGSAGKCKPGTLPLEVEIDIMPGTEPNCIKINDHGSIEVAILGSDSISVDEVLPDSLNFAGLDVLFKGNGKPQCSVEDVSNDGIHDLVCRFEDDAEAWSPNNDSTATLTGTLADGTLFQGTDDFCLR